MKDVNGNKLPDDAWYELAGSDYYFSTTLKNYELTYVNPGDSVAREVPWKDSFGETGSIHINSAHTQPYYPLSDSFPHISSDAYTLSGTRIRGAVDVDHPPILVSQRRAFGYADNTLRGEPGSSLPDNPYTSVVEHSGGDAFDLDWAVDAAGAYVDLDVVHFIKVQNALQADGKWLGELSTEVCGALDVSPDPSISGDLDLIVIRDLPLEITTREYPMELKVFHGGRLIPNPDVVWVSSSDEVTVDRDHVLRASGSGEVNLTAYLRSMPHIRTEIFTRIQLEQTTGMLFNKEDARWQLFPNPARDMLYIHGLEQAALGIFTPDGKQVGQVDAYQGGPVDVSPLTPGLYILRINQGSSIHSLKFIKD
jgi:hypothetical protein